MILRLTGLNYFAKYIAQTSMRACNLVILCHPDNLFVKSKNIIDIEDIKFDRKFHVDESVRFQSHKWVTFAL